MVNEFTSEPVHDPAAEILGVERHAVSPEDRERFMKTVWLAMEVLNRHPNTTETTSPMGKPVKEVSDTIELPNGEFDINILFGMTTANYKTELPSTEITLISKADTYHPVSGVKLAPVTRVEFWGNGDLWIDYADTLEDMDSGTSAFRVHVDNVQHPHDDDYDSDWDHLEEIEQAIQALDDKVPPR